ncbi:MAG TPA: hypothetical protein VKY45_11935 [Marinilabiliaceae bacterium]|nr:hypothetical protein [Marinilabiliaceae bacterium]
MRKIIFSLIAICLSLYVFGQEPETGGRNWPDPETRATELTKKMKDLIQLSEKQEAKVYELNLQNIKKRQEMFQNRTEDREAMQKKMKASDDDYEASLKKVLDENQFSKYIEKKQEIRQRSRERRQSRPADK